MYVNIVNNFATKTCGFWYLSDRKQKKLQSQIAHIEKQTDQEVKDFQQALHMNKEDSLQRIEEENQIKVKEGWKRKSKELGQLPG